MFLTLNSSFLKLSKFYIAYFLVTVLCLGTCIVPVVHAVNHYLEDSGQDASHEHPDFVAWLDASQHEVDTDLDCILCSSTGMFAYSLSVSVYLQFKASQLRSNPHVLLYESLIISQGIRGPPVA